MTDKTFSDVYLQRASLEDEDGDCRVSAIVLQSATEIELPEGFSERRLAMVNPAVPPPTTM